MTAPAIAEKFSNMFTLPASLDFAMLVVGDDLNQLERSVDRFEIEIVRWRAALLARLQPAFDEIKRNHPAVPEVAETVSEAIRALDAGIASFSEPMHSNPAIAERIDQLSSISTGAGKFARKLMRRVEEIRVSQHAFFVDMYYGLLAFQSELETSPEEVRSFDDPAQLGAFLRSQIA